MTTAEAALVAALVIPARLVHLRVSMRPARGCVAIVVPRLARSAHRRIGAVGRFVDLRAVVKASFAGRCKSVAKYVQVSRHAFLLDRVRVGFPRRVALH